VRTEQTAPIKEKTKRKRKQPSKKKNTTISMLSLDSPAMCTRSKKLDPASPAMSTHRWICLGVSELICMFVSLDL
jgi:hypothetical protein